MATETFFGRYLKRMKITRATAAADLKLTRSYVQMLQTGAATPGLHTAFEIQKWSKNAVTMQSWIKGP